MALPTAGAGRRTWEDVWRLKGDQMSEFSVALGRLRSAQKSSSGAAAYSRFVNRPLGRPLAAAASVVGLTPSQVTLASAVCTFTGIALIVVLEPSWWSSLLVTLLLVLGYALDSADGQLARLTGTGSIAGEWLDHFFDALKTATIHLAVFVSWVRFFDDPPAVLAIPLVFSAVAVTFFFGMLLADFLRRIHRLSAATPAAPKAEAAYRMSPLYSLAVLPTDYGFLCLIMLTMWVHPLFVVLYGLMGLATAGALVLAAARWYRSLLALGRTS